MIFFDVLESFFFSEDGDLVFFFIMLRCGSFCEFENIDLIILKNKSIFYIVSYVLVFCMNYFVYFYGIYKVCFIVGFIEIEVLID